MDTGRGDFAEISKEVFEEATEKEMRGVFHEGEILNIKPEHLDLNLRLLYIPITKTGKPRTIPISSQFAKELRKYFNTHRKIKTKGVVYGWGGWQNTGTSSISDHTRTLAPGSWR